MSKQLLQNQKYRDCIEACNACAESCEFCATSCLRQQDVKMLQRCIQLNRECAILHQKLCQWMVNLQNRSVMYVLTYAMHVPKSVENIVKWIIVSNVQKKMGEVYLIY